MDEFKAAVRKLTLPLNLLKAIELMDDNIMGIPGKRKKDGHKPLRMAEVAKMVRTTPLRLARAFKALREGGVEGLANLKWGKQGRTRETKAYTKKQIEKAISRETLAEQIPFNMATRAD